MAALDSSLHLLFDARAELTACGLGAADALTTLRPDDVRCAGCRRVLEQYAAGRLQPPGRARIAAKIKPPDG